LPLPMSCYPVFAGVWQVLFPKLFPSSWDERM
jgi:hypothetical protein